MLAIYYSGIDDQAKITMRCAQLLSRLRQTATGEAHRRARRGGKNSLLGY
jgi:hypothetical protein